MNNFELFSLFSTALLFFIGVFTLDAGRKPCSRLRWAGPEALCTGANGKAVPKEASLLAVVINVMFVAVMLFYGYAVLRDELDARNKVTAEGLVQLQVVAPYSLCS